MTPTLATGVCVNDFGAIVVRYVGDDDKLREIDITGNVQNYAHAIYENLMARAAEAALPGTVVSAPSTRTRQ